MPGSKPKASTTVTCPSQGVCPKRGKVSFLCRMSWFLLYLTVAYYIEKKFCKCAVNVYLHVRNKQRVLCKILLSTRWPEFNKCKCSASKSLSLTNKQEADRLALCGELSSNENRIHTSPRIIAKLNHLFIGCRMKNKERWEMVPVNPFFRAGVETQMQRMDLRTQVVEKRLTE